MRRLMGATPYPLITGLLLLAGFVLLAARLLRFTADNSAELLYGDRWFYWDPLFNDAGWARAFLWQYGSHRLGVGAWVTMLTAGLSDWDARVEALAVAALVVANGALALALARRLLGRLTPLDLVIPTLFLTLFQYEVLVVVPSASLSTLPITFLLAGCLALVAARPLVRYGILTAATALSVYTGFGYVLAPAAIVVLLADIARDPRHRRVKVAALLAILAAVGTFFVGYDFPALQRNIACPPGADRPYGAFWALLWNAFFQLTYRGLPGLALPAVVVATAAATAWLLVRRREDRRPLVLLLLFGFSLAYSLVVTVGRSCLGVDSAEAPRYVPFLIPAYFAVYLLPQVGTRRSLAIALAGAFALLAAQWTFRNDTFLTTGPFPLAVQLRAWQACYAGGSPPPACDAATGRTLLADAPTSPTLDSRLAFLRDHRLGAFRDR